MPAQRKHHRQAAQPAPEPPPEPYPVHSIPGTLLASRLVGSGRTRPAVVVSYKSDAGKRRINAQFLAQQLGDEADVFEIANGVETRKLQDGLPEDLHVFGTGARVYPAGPGWAARTPPARLVVGSTDLGRLTNQLLGDVHAAAHSGFPSPPAELAKPARATATGTVRGFTSEDNSRALVKLSTTGKIVTVRAEDLLPGVPLNWLLTPGQSVTGLLDEGNGTLDISALLLKPGSPISSYSEGDVALARVRSAGATHAMVTLWPGSDFRIGTARISSNELDSAEDLLTEGEVVRVRVLYENGAVVLSMLDVDDDEPIVPAPPLVKGGPPWLDLDRPYASIFAPPAAPLPGEPSAGNAAAGTGAAGVVLEAQEPALTPAERKTALKSTQMELEKARHTIAELQDLVDKLVATDKAARTLQDKLAQEHAKANDLARRHNDAVHQIDAFKAELAKTTAKLVGAKKQRRSASSRSESSLAGLFPEPEEQFDFELRHEWALMVPAMDKAAQPLGEYVVGPGFLATLSQLPAPQRAKTLRAAVDLIANREGPLRNRKPHFLRENEGAHAPARMRGDDVCWRLYVEQGTAGALRLHYWKLKSGGFELHEVVTHDDVKP